jgi:ATP-dependent RNA helicase DDX52/ROK1
MDELFNILSSSARLDKSKRGKKRKHTPQKAPSPPLPEDSSSSSEGEDERKVASRDRTGKRDTSEAKLQQVHREQISAFRRSMSIRLANKHDPDVPDPLSSFDELQPPQWWKDETSFQSIVRPVRQNIESGKWREPTPIQMQCIPTLLQRRDLIGCAPTGSGKSGAFIIPSLLLSSAPYDAFYASEVNKLSSNKKKASHEGEIRSLLLAPSRELAAQLHREVERLGMGKPGGLTSLLLSKSNASNVISGSAGGKKGLDVLVTTPMRLVDSIEKGLDMNSLRLVVLDEADRLLDATDHLRQQQQKQQRRAIKNSEDSDSSSDEDEAHDAPTSGSNQTQSFLAQIDTIFSATPATATRALCSATVTPMVRSLAESILRNPVDVTIAAPGTMGGANTDIEQELMFVGREEGKLLAMRQLAQRGQLRPPAIVFVQSQERAQALFGELLYDNMHVDVIHAGRSRTARDNAVAKFRRGDTWVLICTDLVARGVDFRAVNMVINYDLPTSGITYVHRIGRTGRAGRKGKAITLFTEADFENLRTIANVMKQSGCEVPEWMLTLKKKKRKARNQAPRRPKIDTTSSYDKVKRMKKKQSIENSKKKKALEQQTESS